MLTRYIVTIVSGIAVSAFYVLLALLIMTYIFPVGVQNLDVVGSTLLVLLAGSGFLTGILAAERGWRMSDRLNQILADDEDFREN